MPTVTDATTLTPVPPRLTFSFAAAGWLQTYHFGVAKAIQELGQDTEDVRYCGSSAGSLAAAALVSKVDFDALLEYAVSCVTDCRSSPLNAFRIREYVLVGVERFAVQPFRADAALREHLNRQLEVYMSILPWCRSKVVSEFHTVEDLEEALIASCCLVPLAGLPLRLRHTGEFVCDGGLTAFQPRKGQHRVITVSAMYFNRADIRPSTFLPMWYGLYPPNEAKYREIFDEGYNDAVRYLVKEKLAPASSLERLRNVPVPEVQTKWDLLLDIATGVAFMVFIRPWAVGIIYFEMLFSTLYYLIVAALHIRKSSKWERFLHATQNLASVHNLLHFFLGPKIEVPNLPRLERHSRIYRILQPILYR